MSELGVDEQTPLLEVWNKIDNVDEPEPLRTKSAREEAIFATSAVTGEGMAPLLAAISENVLEARSSETLSLAFKDGRKRAWLFEQEVVEGEEQSETGFSITVLWTATQKARFEKL